METQKTKNAQLNGTNKPKRLSKCGEWLRDNPGGWLEIVDMKAVLK